MCYSGGAEGADRTWSKHASSAGHRVVHYVPYGRTARDTSPSVQYVRMGREKLLNYEPYLLEAKQKCRRSFPTKNEFVNDLLLRNYPQIERAESVYAVGRRIKDKSELGIDGGTGWTCQLYVDRCRREHLECRLYLFDQNTLLWYAYSLVHREGDEQQNDTERVAVAAVQPPDWLPPMPSGMYAAIGSRELTLAGQLAIRSVFSRDPPDVE